MKGYDPDDRLRASIVDAMAARFTADLKRDGMSPADAAAISHASRDRLMKAPVLVIPFLDSSVLDAYADTPRQDVERVMGIQGVAAAISMLLLAFHASGLGSCWYCAPLFTPDVFQEVLAIPVSWSPQAFITTGHVATGGNQRVTPRQPVEAIAFTPGHFKEGGGEP